MISIYDKRILIDMWNRNIENATSYEEMIEHERKVVIDKFTSHQKRNSAKTRISIYHEKIRQLNRQNQALDASIQAIAFLNKKETFSVKDLIKYTS